MIVELHKTGKSSGEIARYFDIATELVWRLCREYAVSGEGFFGETVSPCLLLNSERTPS